MQQLRDGAGPSRCALCGMYSDRCCCSRPVIVRPFRRGAIVPPSLLCVVVPLGDCYARIVTSSSDRLRNRSSATRPSYARGSRFARGRRAIGARRHRPRSARPRSGASATAPRSASRSPRSTARSTSSSATARSSGPYCTLSAGVMPGHVARQHPGRHASATGASSGKGSGIVGARVDRDRRRRVHRPPRVHHRRQPRLRRRRRCRSAGSSRASRPVRSAPARGSATARWCCRAPTSAATSWSAPARWSPARCPTSASRSATRRG